MPSARWLALRQILIILYFTVIIPSCQYMHPYRTIISCPSPLKQEHYWPIHTEDTYDCLYFYKFSSWWQSKGRNSFMYTLWMSSWLKYCGRFCIGIASSPYLQFVLISLFFSWLYVIKFSVAWNRWKTMKPVLQFYGVSCFFFAMAAQVM